MTNFEGTITINQLTLRRSVFCVSHGSEFPSSIKTAETAGSNSKNLCPLMTRLFHRVLVNKINSSFLRFCFSSSACRRLFFRGDFRKQLIIAFIFATVLLNVSSTWKTRSGKSSASLSSEASPKSISFGKIVARTARLIVWFKQVTYSKTALFPNETITEAPSPVAEIKSFSAQTPNSFNRSLNWKYVKT